MNKITAAVVSALLLAGTAAPALARDGEVSVKASASARTNFGRFIKDLRDKFRGESKERKEEFKREVEQKKDEIRTEKKEQFSDARKERIQSWWKRVHRRLSSLIERQYKIEGRIQERVDRLKAAGRDVTKIQADLDSAKLKIDAAKTGLASASASVEVIVTTNAPKEAFAELHTLQKGVLGKVREAHGALVKVLVSTKGLSVTPSPSASASVSASVSPTATP